MDLPGVVTDLGDVRSHTQRVAEEVCSRWALTFVWGIGSSGEHEEGRALDFMGFRGGTVKQPGPMDRHLCSEIAAYLWANRERLGVWYVIWDRRIISTNPNNAQAYLRWADYHGESPHTDHVHVSFLDKPPAYRGPDGAVPDEEEEDMTPEQAAQLKAVHAAVTGIASQVTKGSDGKAARHSAGWYLSVGQREDRRILTSVLDVMAGVVELTRPVSIPDEDRQALADDIAGRVDSLRIAITREAAEEDTDEPA